MIFLKWLEELKEYYKKLANDPLSIQYNYAQLHLKQVELVDNIIDNYKENEKNIVIYFEKLRKFCKYSSYRVDVIKYKCYSTENNTINCNHKVCPLLQDNRKEK